MVLFPELSLALARSLFILGTYPWLADTPAFLSFLCASALRIFYSSKAPAELQGFRLSLAQMLPRRDSRNHSLSIQRPLMLCHRFANLLLPHLRVGELGPSPNHTRWTNHERMSAAPHSPPHSTFFLVTLLWHFERKSVSREGEGRHRE